LRFYLDEHFSPRVAEISRGHGLDVISALELSVQEDRCLVTHDKSASIRHTVRSLERHEPHNGVLLIPRSLHLDHFTGIAEALRMYAESRSDTPMTYVIDFSEMSS